VASTKNPVKLTFENLCYTVNVKLSKEEMQKKGVSSPSMEKTIVKNATGCAFPGQTLFIMGASGAGKTSLLNILSDRISLKGGAKLTGDIKINDKYPLNQDTFGGFGSYVMQDDILFAHFTPR